MNIIDAIAFSDGLTKPLQGKMFVDFRNHLLNPGYSTDEGVCCVNPNMMSDKRRECMGDEQRLKNLHLQLGSGKIPDPS